MSAGLTIELAIFPRDVLCDLEHMSVIGHVQAHHLNWGRNLCLMMQPFSRSLTFSRVARGENPSSVGRASRTDLDDCVSQALVRAGDENDRARHAWCTLGPGWTRQGAQFRISFACARKGLPSLGEEEEKLHIPTKGLTRRSLHVLRPKLAGDRLKGKPPGTKDS